MTAAIDADRWRAAAHRNMFAHLPGPFAGGAVESPLAIVEADGAAVARVEFATRQPLVAVAPRVALGGDGWRLQAALLEPDGADPPRPLPPLRFAPWTEAGSFLPVHRPPADEATGRAAAFALRFDLVVEEEAGERAVPADEAAALLEACLIEGVLGRLVFALGQEQGRLRRQAREIAAMRRLATARDDGLDRLGAELGVPRLDDDLVRLPDGGRAWATRREPDAGYRRRLAIYRPLLLPTRAALRDRLNGPPAAGPANAGLLAPLGVAARIDLVERDTPFAVAIHLVDADNDARRPNLLRFVRQVHLIHPGPEGDGVHAARFLPAAGKAATDALRLRLRDGYDWPIDAAVAPMLARVLDRAARVRRALGDGSAWAVLRAQDADGGSRHELGLGVEIAPPDTATLDILAALAADPGRAPAEDPEVEALLREMTPAPAAADPDGRWLLQPCGVRTVHQLDGGTLFLSHLPTFGMTVAGPSVATTGQAAAFEARYHAPGDPGRNAVLAAALPAALRDWDAAGNDPLLPLADDAADALWGEAAATAPEPAVLDVLRLAGLPAPAGDTLPATVERLRRLPPEMIDTVALPQPLVDRLAAGDPTAAADLRGLVAVLRRQGLASALPLAVGGAAVALVVGVIGLPGAGVNLADRRTTGFRWYAVPIDGPGGAVKAIGSRTTFVPAGPGLTALVALGYARRDGTDPYEVRVELPEGAVLDFEQYEFLMNLLAHDCPIGVEVNTFALRRDHVDVAGDAAADPMAPSVARTYRAFQRARHRGAIDSRDPDRGSGSR